MKKKCWLTALVILMIVCVSDFVYHKDRLYTGVFVDGLDLGRKRTGEAAELLREKFEQDRIAERVIILQADGKSWRLSFGELGVSPDIEGCVTEAFATGRERFHLLRYPQRIALMRAPVNVVPVLVVDVNSFYAAVSEAAESIRQEPENAAFILSDDRLSVSVRPERLGEKLDAQATREALEAALLTYPEVDTVPLVKKTMEAEITAAYLESLNVKEPVSTFSTTFSAKNANRNENIRLAAQAMDKTLILPDQQFSFNDVVGNTTAEKGYKVAPIIVGGEFEEGLGGGICQVSSTLYNAVLLADLGIVERKNHGLAVGYLPPGRDATIAYSWIDFKFLNDRNHAIWLRTFVDGNRLTTTLYGSLIPGHSVTVQTTDLSSIIPEEKVIKTAELPIGAREQVKKGQPGYRVTVWRITSMNGEEVRREMISQDTYRAVPAEYRVGTAEVPAAATGNQDSKDSENVELRQENQGTTENEADG